MSARILVVDDVPANVKLLAAKLTREYFDVLTADSGPKAIEIAHQEAPDIILLDVMMPGMDGFEVCRRLKADGRTLHIPIVMVTALSDGSDRVTGLESGADDFLTKPVNDIALFARVRSLVRLKQTMDEWRMRERTSDELGVVGGEESELAESAEHARILVVEESDLQRAKIVQTLQADSATVTSTPSIDDADRLARSEEFDLVVASLMLAEDGGLRLVSRLRCREATRQIPILLVTQEEDIQRVAKGMEIGANDYILKPIDRNELKARARIQIRRKRFQDRLRSNYQRSLSMALTDELTGLFNRHYLGAHLARMIARIAEMRKPVVAIMLDIDHFKSVNDTYGHAVGDQVLKEVAVRVSRNLRNFDMVARFGGEEFIIVMPDSSLEGAVLVAERLRLRIAEEAFAVAAPVRELHVTISLGVAATEDADMTPSLLINDADQALYAAKRKGRNCVVAKGLDTLPPDLLAAAVGG
ncbi:MAG: PleD family two-component system response regulator [Rhodospirillaceae bacterium]|nr:PleD family two-component system response regulator [Rhodospirillaceae bacterium]